MTEERRPRLVIGPIQEDWIEHGSCVGAPAEVFFPPRGSNGVAARKICAGCPVRQECLDYAIENREQWGIWGGMDLDQRLAEARARRVA